MVAASPAIFHSPPILRRAPMLCAASSMTGMPLAIFATSSTAATWPNRSTGTMALVFDVIAAAAAAGLMLNVRGSMSTNTGVAPTL